MLVLAEVGGEHQDAPALLCIVAAAWCLVRGRGAVSSARLDAAAGALVVLAAAIKPSLAIVAPIVVLGATRATVGARGRWPGRASVAGLADLAAFGGALPDLGTQGVARHAAVAAQPARAGGRPRRGRRRRARRRARRRSRSSSCSHPPRVLLRRDRALPAMAVVLVAAVLALPWVMPWYLVWALPFLALARARDRRPRRGRRRGVADRGRAAAGDRRSCTGPGYFPTHHATGPGEPPASGEPAAMKRARPPRPLLRSSASPTP